MTKTHDEAMAVALDVPLRANVATLLKYQHEERIAQIEKPGREDKASFTLKRSTASGSLGAVGADVYVPVCDEFPTASEAFEAAMYFMDSVNKHYPLPITKPVPK
jgi:hypothetical protein